MPLTGFQPFNLEAAVPRLLTCAESRELVLRERARETRKRPAPSRRGFVRIIYAAVLAALSMQPLNHIARPHAALEEPAVAGIE